MNRVAVVTGANRGIGLEIVKSLCKQFQGDVVLTARDPARGHEAVQQLERDGFHAKFHLLDITNTSHIEGLRKFLLATYGGLDVLVNNAGIMYIGKEKEEVAAIVQATTTLQVNLFGHLEVYKHLFPIFRPHARIVNIASTLGLLNYNNNEEVREKLMSGELTMQDIVNLAEEYLRDVEQGLEEQKDWPDAYSVSKTLVMAATRVQARELAEDSHEDVIVNSCCPGWVKTNLTGNRGVKSPALGADTPVYLALLPPNCASPVGEFVVDRKIRRVR